MPQNAFIILTASKAKTIFVLSESLTLRLSRQYIYFTPANKHQVLLLLPKLQS